MHSFPRILVLFASLGFLAACSSEDTKLSAEDYQKPQNAAALEEALSSCKLVFANDPRSANCKEARNAKFALETLEIGRIRREQIAERLAAEAGDGGVTTVEKSAPAPSTAAAARQASSGIQARALSGAENPIR